MDQLGSLGQTSVATAVSADGSVIVGSAWVGTSFEDQEQRALFGTWLAALGSSTIGFAQTVASKANWMDGTWTRATVISG
ncbi:MAG: hypothetical protein U0836_00095 [Pirellulales bacterium]